MNEVTALFLRRMQAPILLIVIVYSISIVGLLMIPGMDDNGNPTRMSIFHAFYFVSYTATTIGFGEIPYPLTNAQRLWSIAIIYMTVISWFYALGTVIALFQDKQFLHERHKLNFQRDVKNLNTPYYVVCGFGETGHAVVKALQEEHFGAVVIEKEENLSERVLDNSLEYIPSLTDDATKPESLEMAKVDANKCRGVIAVTASDEINLEIAISSKLLHPDVKVICRSDDKEHEDNMLSFGTDHIINPFDTFASIFGMALHSPATHLIYDWLTGAPDTSISTPVRIDEGHWILCGYGRFGRCIHRELLIRDIDVVIIDPNESIKELFEDNDNVKFIVGTGTDAPTLLEAGVDKAAGVIAGSNSDSNNLSIIMTARQLRHDIFVIARQNIEKSQRLYRKINDYYTDLPKEEQGKLTNTRHMVMQPYEIIARNIRTQLISPLLLDFFKDAMQQDQEWANITISRLSAVIEDNRPITWSLEINKEKAPGLVQALAYGRHIEIHHILLDPQHSKAELPCVCLLVKRGDTIISLPESELELKNRDKILFCGDRAVKNEVNSTAYSLEKLNSVMCQSEENNTYVWNRFKSLVRRTKQSSNRRSNNR